MCTGFVGHGEGGRQLDLAREIVLQVVEAFGGRPVKGIDGVWVHLFTDPEEALEAAVEIQRSIRDVRWGGRRGFEWR